MVMTICTMWFVYTLYRKLFQVVYVVIGVSSGGFRGGKGGAFDRQSTFLRIHNLVNVD